MRRTIAAVLLLAFVAPSLAAQHTPDDVLFKKDVKQYVPSGDKTKDVEVTLTIGAESLIVTRKDNDRTVIPFSAITGATYDRRARQRKMFGIPMTGQSMAGAAQKLQHFLTVKFQTATAGDYVELELGKDIANRVVTTLETRTGKPVEKIIGG
jgi:hypothetical protein